MQNIAENGSSTPSEFETVKTGVEKTFAIKVHEYWVSDNLGYREKQEEPLTRPFVVLFGEKITTSANVIVYDCRNKDFSNRPEQMASLLTMMAQPEHALPSPLDKSFRFPKLLASEPKEWRLMEEYVQSFPAGSLHRADPNIFTKKQVWYWVQFIRHMQKAGSVFVGDGTRIHPRISDPLVKKYHFDFDNKPDGTLSDRVKSLRHIVGYYYIRKMQSILNSDETANLFTPSSPKYFAIGDLTPGSIGYQNEKYVIYGLKRQAETPIPAYDYVTLFTAMWSKPQAQNSFLKESVRINRDIPNFLEYFRLDFIFNRGSGELAYWMEELNHPNRTEHPTVSRDAVMRLSTLLVDAINNTGIWEPSQYQKRAK